MAKSFLDQPGLPRGLRNNNPGNLRYNGDNWQGMIGQDSANFMRFSNISYGIRALAIDLQNDMTRKNKNTIRTLINEFAPGFENNTQAYISTMVNLTGYAADQMLEPTYETLTKLIRGIMNVELGTTPATLVTDADILTGLRMMPTPPVSMPVLVTSSLIALALLGGALYALATMEPMPKRAGHRSS